MRSRLPTLSPSTQANIFLLSDGRAKLSNFTCAFQYVVGQPTDRNSLSAVVSTPQLPSLYCDPEYYKEKDINYLPLPTTAGDVWSFGSILLSVCVMVFRLCSILLIIPTRRLFQTVLGKKTSMITSRKLPRESILVIWKNALR